MACFPTLRNATSTERLLVLLVFLQSVVFAASAIIIIAMGHAEDFDTLPTPPLAFRMYFDCYEREEEAQLAGVLPVWRQNVTPPFSQPEWNLGYTVDPNAQEHLGATHQSIWSMAMVMTCYYSWLALQSIVTVYSALRLQQEEAKYAMVWIAQLTVLLVDVLTHAIRPDESTGSSTSDEVSKSANMLRMSAYCWCRLLGDDWRECYLAIFCTVGVGPCITGYGENWTAHDELHAENPLIGHKGGGIGTSTVPYIGGGIGGELLVPRQSPTLGPPPGRIGDPELSACEYEIVEDWLCASANCH